MSQLPQTTAAQLGAAIRLLREGAGGMSLETLAGKASIHWTYLSQIENGKRNPTWDVLCRLATALNVEILELVRLAGDQAASEN